MIILPIGAIHGVETNNLWILVDSLSKSNYPYKILFHALALKFIHTEENQRKLTTTIRTIPNYTLYCSWPRRSSCCCDGCHQCTLSLIPQRTVPEKVNHDHQSPNWWLCVIAPWASVKNDREVNNFSIHWWKLCKFKCAMCGFHLILKKLFVV